MNSSNLRSFIKPGLLRSYLFPGTLIAGTGSFILLFAGIFIPLDLLSFWGLPLIISAFLLIAIGLYPYKKLKKIEINPHEITFLDDHQFLFSWQKKPLFIANYKDIKNISYIDLKADYGIAIILNDPKSITWINPDFNHVNFQAISQKKYGCDLFLHNFSKHSFNELVEFFDLSK